jgi:hypothetical protein
MNGKQIACILLLSLIAAIVYGGQMVNKTAEAMRKSARAAEDAAISADSARKTSEIKLQTVTAESEEILRFLAAWTPIIDGIQTGQDIEEAIQSSIRASSLYVDSQKFEAKVTRTGKVLARIIKAAIVAEDEYSKTMNWLGELEKKVPLARITICRITPGKDPKSIRLELSIEVPILNLNADPTEAKIKGA